MKSDEKGFWVSIKNAVLLWNHPLWSIVFSTIIFLAMAMLREASLESSPYPFYNYLADAFLHSQFHLRILPPTIRDLIFINGKYYLYWPPFPAILMMPFVALFGVSFSDILFTVILGGINVFGLFGLLYGPLIVGLTMVFLYMYSLEFESFLNHQDRN